MKPILSRRQFLQTTAGTALVAPIILPGSVLGQEAPSKRLHVGCIGVGPQGRGVMGNFLAQRDCRVLALCDVSKRNLEAAVKQVNGAYKDEAVQTHADYRDLLARPDIDAVLIATPDHWHVPVAVAAARAGKDMYLEKPMGLSVQEDKQLRRACQNRQRIFQFGTQQRSSQQFRQACELVRNGRLGKLRNIDVWAAASMPGGSTAPIAAPADLAYDFWLGPAPETPYTLGKAYDEDGRLEDLVVQLRLRAGLHRRLGGAPAGHRLLGSPGDDGRSPDYRRTGGLPAPGRLQHVGGVECPLRVRQPGHDALPRHPQRRRADCPQQLRGLDQEVRTPGGPRHGIRGDRRLGAGGSHADPDLAREAH
ncbi:MAG: Gfo/Idh/MocA family oxidoreductase [Verrucomicrobia bacterium]|nr:Gfo/Idh/MocA family oxidoreductase [Verrucomicrobiota bacterium]